MAVGRNDYCPCGSGEKYKKCCLRKDEQAGLMDAFFQRKNTLIVKMTEKVFSTYHYEQILALKKEFQERVSANIPDSFFQHWFLFFYEDQNGVRAIEWYNRSEGNQIDRFLHELALAWEQLSPRLLQQASHDEKGVTVKDVITDEEFYLPYGRSLPRWEEQTGTFCTIEEYNGSYYVHGGAIFVSDKQVKQAHDFLHEKMRETNQSYEAVAKTFYPEVLRALLEERRSTTVTATAAPSIARTEEDYKIMEEIGIPFEEDQQFYVNDILEHFRDKAEGKSQSTYYKYRLGLQTIGYFLSQKMIFSWSDINRSNWEKWLTFNYLAFNMDATVNQVKGFHSVLTSFTAYIDETYGTDHNSIVRDLIKELEPSILKAVKVLDAHASYQERRSSDVYSMDTLFDKLEKGVVIEDHQVDAVFRVEKAEGEKLYLEVVNHDGESYEARFPEYPFETGMILVGRIIKGDEWKLDELNRVFPPECLSHILPLLK